MISNVVSEEVPANSGINLDVDDLKEKVERVLAEKLYWFPVRHHSPSVAMQLKNVLLKRKPKIIFIEGPSQATDLIPHIISSKTKPPVAIYSSFRDDNNILQLAGILSPAADIPPVFAAWYPFLQYSPEYVALQVAQQIGARALFIDLPHYARIKPLTERFGMTPEAHKHDPDDDHGPDQAQENQPHDDSPESVEETDQVGKHEANGDKNQDGDDAKSSGELLMIESRFYQELAKAAGYRSFDEAWDTLFEMRDFGDAEEFRREFALFCAASRATTHPSRIRHDGTLERERHMLEMISSTLAEQNIDPSEAVVVCGGFHLFADREDKRQSPPPPQGTVYNTIVPYSFFQVSELAGYGAGTRAPQFYQMVWNLTAANRAQDILVEHVVRILTEIRKKGQIVSSADAIAVSQHAEMLARLRGRPAPILDDIHAALITCCCKGDPNEEGTVLFRALDQADIGTAIGKVTPDLGQLPIVKDFYNHLDDLGLAELMGAEKRLSVELDKREQLHERRSAFLHRLRFLQVPVCALSEAPTGDFASGKLFKEKWQMKWSPAVEAELIELNLYGDSIEAAALARLREQLRTDENHAGRTSRHLIQAVNMNLPDLTRSTEASMSAAIDADLRFISLTEALTNLLILDRYLLYRDLRKGMLDDLIVRCFDKSCFSILDVVSVPEHQQEEVVAALLALAEAMQQGDKQALDRSLFVEHVRCAANTTTVPFLRGAFFGMLCELNEADPLELAYMVSGLACASPDIMVSAGDLLDGVMAVSRTSILIGADALIKSIDELLRAAEWDPFLVMLPRMRAAFERMNSGHRDSIATRVAELYGLKEGTSISELRISTQAAITVARIDQQVARIMEEWRL